jgi:hypothetical protein
VGANPSPDGERGHWITRLTPGERVSGSGAAVVAASLLFPWYGIRFSGGLSVTGLDSFGFAHAALLLTVGAALAVIARRVAGRSLPRPLDEGTLVAAAGVWASVLAGYLMADRPEELGGSTSIGLRFGAFLALGGALVVVVGGLRMRREKRISAGDV